MTKVCLTCHQPFGGRGIKYCSVKCRDAAPKGIRSEETRKKLSAALRRRPKPWQRGEGNPNWGNKARGGSRAHERYGVNVERSTPRTAYVYAIINKKDGSTYIGWTTSVHVRWGKHRFRAAANWPGHLYSAIRLHGIDSFSFEIWETWPSEGEARKAEIRLIAHLKALGTRVYNMTDGGEGTTGRVMSAETRRKISEKAKLRPPLSEEAREKIRKANTGRVASEEERRRNSEGQKGRVSAWKGKTLPTEMKEKIRQGAFQRWARTREAQNG